MTTNSQSYNQDATERLMAAAHINDSEAIIAALQQGANPNAKDQDGIPAAILMANALQEKFAPYNPNGIIAIIQHPDTDLLTRDQDGFHVLDHIKAKAFSSAQLIEAATSNNADDIVFTLMSGANPYITDPETGDTPLMKAISAADPDDPMYQNHGILGLAMVSADSFDYRNKAGQTVFDLAHHPEIQQILSAVDMTMSQQTPQNTTNTDFVHDIAGTLEEYRVKRTQMPPPDLSGPRL